MLPPVRDNTYSTVVGAMYKLQSSVEENMYTVQSSVEENMHTVQPSTEENIYRVQPSVENNMFTVQPLPEENMYKPSKEHTKKYAAPTSIQDIIMYREEPTSRDMYTVHKAPRDMFTKPAGVKEFHSSARDDLFIPSAKLSFNK